MIHGMLKLMASRRSFLLLLLIVVSVAFKLFGRYEDVTAADKQTMANPAAITCPGQGHGNADVPVNLEHIFCGELNRKNRFTGFHARPHGLTPASIANVAIVPGSENANGIYDATVYWDMDRNGDDQPVNPSKFSTMFPDTCSQSQIIASILYANDHRAPACPVGAPGWAQCGPNRPGAKGNVDAPADSQYCIGNDPSARFTIAYATHNGRINTAFPLNDGQ
ncbi:hypothetical protein CSC3H3_17690 [Thalassospira marina]|uniref:Bacterial EndoU nuclease domain-containing protein n=2 Tax=Thalassospira marina TaxID=2048283 RepID=A0ABM6QCQ5_9PROT|nr:hypothetical protein CSC3H3_17690 [Thalassospira marina]